MGNSPSTSKPGSQSSSYQSNAQNESPRPVRRDNKHPIPVHDRRVAAPPEPSLTQAQGTAVQPPPSSSSNRSNPLQHRPVALASGNSTPSATDATVVSSTPIPTGPIEGKQGTPSPSPGPAKPVDVPYPHNSPSSPRSPRSPTSDDTYEPFTMPHSSLQDISYLTRPPRLPLPIEEEVYTPGSPIISPADIGQPLDDVDELFDNSGLVRPLSTLSNNDAADEYEEEDDLEGLLVDKTGPRVPTTLEWRHGGEKIYITGSMYQWGRKTRLRPVEGRVGVYAATVPCNPGTHHIRFLVDGNMKTSPDYPQAVDTTNTLVNYIEVSADGLKNSPKPAEGDATSQATKERKKAAEEGEGSDAGQEAEQKRPKYREVPLASLFEHKIPRYLLDFDQPEDTPPYHSACSAIEKLPNPPALPGFLGKPILNAASLIKDDNSVLNMPNHTVLNHLATSSIKNNILAVSATTRYKNKYITTIMYKPTTTEGI